MNGFTIHDIRIGDGAPFVFIGGPCVIESEDIIMKTAEYIREITARLRIPFVFKSSYDKANRLNYRSFRGPGIDKGLDILRKVRISFDVPVLTDVHSVEEAGRAADVVDVLQIPAFLCRQTDLAIACGETGKTVLIKKGQFMAPEDMKHSVEKVRKGGSDRVLLGERGSFFGYRNLVVDMRSLVIMARECPVVFDATHSVQLPGGRERSSSGNPDFILPLARSAAAVGIDGLFVETHPNPGEALCDGPNMLSLNELEELLQSIKEIDQIVKA